MSSAILLLAENGASTPAMGKLTRVGDAQRIGRAVGIALGGFAAAGVCVFIPGVHLITTWLLPLLGLIGARATWQTRARIDDLAGRCPSCAAEIRLEGGRVQRPMIEPCPACHRNLRIELQDEPAGGSAS